MGRNYTSKILVVDVESTCWDRKPPAGEVSEIVEIGLCPVDIKELVIEEPELYYIRPRRSHVSDFCTSITGLTEKEIQKSGVDFWVALNEIITRHDSKHKCMASWGDYDRDAFMSTCKLYGEDYPFGKTHINIKYLHTLMMKRGDGAGLQEATRGLGFEFSGIPHRADCDAFNAASILVRAIEALRGGVEKAAWKPKEISWT